MDDWNFLAATLDGEGHITVTETDLPMKIASIDRTLSAPTTIRGTITNEVKRLKKDGLPIFRPWNTAIIAEAAGLIRGAGIYRKPKFDGAEWQLDVIGFSGYPSGEQYDGAKYFVETDPLDIWRHIWGYLQTRPFGNLGITLSDLKTPVKVGKKLEEVQFTAETSPGKTELVSFEQGPRKLNWYETKDLGREIDQLAKDTPFDWEEQVSWAGDEVRVHLDAGYPQLGGRDTLHRFVLGENLATEPGITDDDYASIVWVLGAGEGRRAVRGVASINENRLRRTRTVEDKNLKTVTSANARAKKELAALRGDLVVEKLEVFDHPNAPLEAIKLGNEYQLYAETDHALVDQYVRVVGRSDAPGQSDRAALTVVRNRPL